VEGKQSLIPDKAIRGNQTLLLRARGGPRWSQNQSFFPIHTLLKAGAELTTILLGLHATFSADTETLTMYGAPGAGVFAYVCRLVDRRGQLVGEGRGVAELREPNFYGSPNIASKMAEKRAYVDAVLRAAGLSNFFTQDLDEPLPPPPEPHDQAPASDARSAQQSPTRASAAPHQVRAIRGLLRQSGRGEQDILQQLEIGALDQLSERRAAKLIARLHELNQQSRAANGT
jgi:hypothetical protein